MATLYFNPSDIALPAVGQTFDVEVKVRDVSDLIYLYFDVAYDASSLRFVSLSLIQDIENLHDPPNMNFAGEPYIRIDLYDDLDPTVSGDVVLATITYEVVNRVASTLGLRANYGGLEDSDFNDIAFTRQTAQLQPPLKQFSYQGHPVSVSVKIHDADVTDDIASVDDIGQGVDYPNLTEFRVGEASFTLRDIHGDFSPNNPSNFFTRHGGRRTGRNSPVEIEAGFIVDGIRHTETIFKGNIIRLTQDATPATVRVVCSDNFGDMRTKGIADFGVPRHFMLTEDLEQTGENGGYPIMDAILPASHGSATLKTEVTDTPIAPVQKLKNEGTLDPRNFIIDANGVRTEGGLIVNRQTGYPQLRMKSPYRYRHILDVITDILNHAGITKSEIAIPERDVVPHFSSNGRVGYDLIGNIGSGNPVTWNSSVNDFLYDSGTWYFLYNGHRNNPNGIAQILAYDTATRTYRQLHKFPSPTEVWKFTKVGDVFYILGSTGGNYDANEQSSENKIFRLDISGTPTETDFVPHTVSLQPQLAHYYHGVGSVFMKPDSRRRLIYHQNALYYAFVNRTNNNFGIAKATAQNTATAVISVNLDNQGNHAGLSFDIKNNTLIGATTFVSNSLSQILVFKKAL